MFDFSLPYDIGSAVHDFRWTPQAMRRFLEVLAECGSVARACGPVSKSRNSAHALRRKSDGQPFGIGWDAALMMARDRMQDRLLEHAFLPTEWEGHRHPHTGRLMWRRCDPYLGAGMGLAHLTRLDKAVADITENAARYDAAHAAAGDWENFLDLVCALQPKTCNLARNSATSHLPAEAVQARLAAQIQESSTRG